MPLHLLKLCVGAESIGDLEAWIAERQAMRRKASPSARAEHLHRTRMVPKRQAELLDGGSLYWVIKGQIAARQRLVDIRPYTDAQGVGQCHLVMDLEVVPVSPRRCRPFQGWRYLQGHEAPADLRGGLADIGQMPQKMQKELRELGLL